MSDPHVKEIFIPHPIQSEENEDDVKTIHTHKEDDYRLNALNPPSMSSEVQNWTCTQELQACISCNRSPCPYRLITEEHICSACRNKHPYKLITRTTCINKYGLTKDILQNATRKRLIRMVNCPNYNPKTQCRMNRLYYDHEIQELIQCLREASQNQSQKMNHDDTDANKYYVYQN